MEINLHYRVCGKMHKTDKVDFHSDNSEVTKSRPKGNDDIVYSIE